MVETRECGRVIHMCQFCVDLINGLLISVTRFVSPLMQLVERYVSCEVLRG